MLTAIDLVKGRFTGTDMIGDIFHGAVARHTGRYIQGRYLQADTMVLFKQV